VTGSCEHGDDPLGFIKFGGSTSFSRKTLLHTVSTVLNGKYCLVLGKHTAHIFSLGPASMTYAQLPLALFKKCQGLQACQCGFLPVTTVTSHVYSVPATLTCVEVITQPLKKRFFSLPSHSVPIYPRVLFRIYLQRTTNTCTMFLIFNSI